MPEITIRHSEKTDLEAIRDIYAGEIAYSGTLQLPLPSLSLWESRLENPPPGLSSFVAVIDQQVVGHLGLEICQNPRRKHVARIGMAVADDHQGKGVGSRLLSSAIELAENWHNCQRIELTVFIDNHAAINLYKKHGFITEGESAKFAFRNGEFVSAYHMARLKA